MKLAKDCLTILNNFVNINKNLIIKQGKVIKTINAAKTVVAEAYLENEMPQDFGISDLKNFLNTLNIFNDPELEFYNDKITIKEDNVEYDYYRASDAVLADPKYGKQINVGDVACEFDLSKDQLKNIIKAANTMKNLTASGTSGIRFYKNQDSEIAVEAKLYKGDIAKNVYRLTLGKDSSLPDFDVMVDSSKFNLIEDDYRVILYKDRCLKMTGLNFPVTYIIAYEVTQ